MKPETLERIQDAAGKSCALQAYGDREDWFCAADVYDDEIARLEAENDRLRKALGWAKRANWIPTPSEVELARHLLASREEDANG